MTSEEPARGASASANSGCRGPSGTDNGGPFATQAIHGLSYLTVWWMRLGIAHQRIHPELSAGEWGA
jgi:hypothetical protein